MTIQKARKIIQYSIQHYTKVADGMEELIKDWTYEYGDENTPKAMGHSISGMARDYIKVLKMIDSQLAPKCKHPKKDRDKTADGQWYCMNCNADL